MNYSKRCYLVFNVSEIDKVDFNQVHETSAETLRRSVDGTKTFIKWDAADTSVISQVAADDPAAAEGQNQVEVPTPGTPTFIGDLTTAEGPYTHEEILQILAGPEWTAPMEA